jgi:IS30 family transposase
MRNANTATNRPQPHHGLTNTEAPKGSDLRVHGPEQLTAVAAELNDRPRKTLSWHSPAARLGASNQADLDHE